MKRISTLLMCLLTLALASCGSSYNADKCEELIDKYDEEQKLSSKELTEAMDQIDAILDKLDKQYDKILNKAKKDKDEAGDMLEEFNEENEDMINHYQTLCRIVNLSDLKGDNKKQFKEIEKKDKAVTKKSGKISQKLNIYF